jgi:hypothetical protein
MSRIMAQITKVTDTAHFPSMAKRMAVTPDASARSVIDDGTSLPMDRSSSRSSRAATIWRARLRRVMRSGSCIRPF